MCSSSSDHNGHANGQRTLPVVKQCVQSGILVPDNIENISEQGSRNCEVNQTAMMNDFGNIINMECQITTFMKHMPQTKDTACNSSGSLSNTVNHKNVEKTPAVECHKPHLFVRINRIKVEHVRQMQQSIKEFIQKSPKFSKKMGLKVLEDQQPKDTITNSITNCKDNTIATNDGTILDDTFNIMKAQEKQNIKRKYPVALDDIPLEQLCEYKQFLHIHTYKF